MTTDPLQETELDLLSWALGRRVSLIERRFKGNGIPLMDQRHPLCLDGVLPSPSLAVL